MMVSLACYPFYPTLFFLSVLLPFFLILDCLHADYVLNGFSSLVVYLVAIRAVARDG
jgi:hypothetical protein